MGKNKFDKSKEFLELMKEENGSVMSFEDFKEEIMIKIGADEERTVRPYIKLMLELKLISSEGENVRIN